MKADELLARIDERTAFIQEQLQGLDNRLETLESKTDKRIGRIESWKNKQIGAFGVVGFILTIFGYEIITR